MCCSPSCVPRIDLIDTHEAIDTIRRDVQQRGACLRKHLDGIADCDNTGMVNRRADTEISSMMILVDCFEYFKITIDARLPLGRQSPEGMTRYRRMVLLAFSAAALALSFA